MLKTMAEMKEVKVSETPVYKWKLALLKDPRLKLPMAVMFKAVGQLDVNITFGFMEDQELWDASLDSTAVTLSNLWIQVKQDLDATGYQSNENAYEYFLGIIQGFKLNYNA